MRIAIIETGNVGGAIAKGLKGKGHQVILGVRNPSAPDSSELAKQTGSSLASPAEAAAKSELIILALPWATAKDAIKSLGNLSDKIVIDCMNPLGMVNGALGLAIGHTTSAGEMVQSWLPNAKVVKTLNQVGAEMMANNSKLSLRPVMFMAGNDEASKISVGQILKDLGFDALDAGDLTKARILEPFAMVWINQALFRGKGRNWAFAAASEK